jgi:hypothetical protein
MCESVKVHEADCLVFSDDNVDHMLIFIFAHHTLFLRSADEGFAFLLLSNNSNTIAKIDLIVIIIKGRAEFINLLTILIFLCLKI